MKPLKFSWDSSKATSNLSKHRISFEDAHARLILDPDHSDEEERFILLGVSVRLKILTVVHCYRDNENTIRIISARKATAKEQNQYKEFLR